MRRWVKAKREAEDREPLLMSDPPPLDASDEWVRQADASVDPVPVAAPPSGDANVLHSPPGLDPLGRPVRDALKTPEQQFAETARRPLRDRLRSKS